jgi:hypothetical protein
MNRHVQRTVKQICPPALGDVEEISPRLEDYEVMLAWKQTIKNTPGTEAEGSCAPHADGSSEDAFVQAEEDSNVAHSVERHAP